MGARRASFAGFCAASLLAAGLAEGAVCPAGTGPSFGVALLTPAGAAPQALLVADFNGDGKNDLAVANMGATAGSSYVSIFLGTGDGTFGPPTTFSVDIGPLAIVAADFNGDTKVDLATANSGANTASILLGAGDGTFGVASHLAVGMGPKAIASGDFNGDTKLDLVVTNAGSNDVSILLGTGAGTFAAATSFATGGSPNAVAVGDWNEDSKLDLAVTSYDLKILIGDGTGAFGAPASVAVLSSGPIAAGDLNQDSHADLAIGGFTVALGNGSGGFAAGGAYYAPFGPESMALGDLNGDGHLDAAVVGRETQVYVYFGDGTGQISGFTLAGFPLPGGSRSVAAGDLNGDGRLDLAVASYGAQPGDVRTFLANCATVQLSIADGFANEGNTSTTNALFWVNLSHLSEHAVTVTYSTADGTAQAGSDYLQTSGTLTFAPGTRSQTIAVQVVGDTLREGTESFLVNLANAVNASMADAQASATISDDEAPVSVSVRDMSVLEGNAGPTAAFFTVWLSGASQAPVTVNYATAPGSMPTATPDVDYTSTSGTLTFASGEIHKAVAVSIIGDTLFENAERLSLNLTAPTNASVFHGTGIGTIVNDDCGPMPLSPGISDGSFEAGAPWPAWTTQTSSNFGTPLCNYLCGDGDGTAPPYFGGNWAWFGGTTLPEVATLGRTVTLPAEPNLTLRFQLRIGAVTSPFTDTLSFSVDGTPLVTLQEPSTPEFAYTAREVPLGLFADGAAHSLLWTYSSAGGSSNFAMDEVELLSCTPLVVPAFAINDVSVAEGNAGPATATFNVTLSPPATATTGVRWATISNTASAADYVTASGTLTFLAGESVKTIDVTVNGDVTFEANETFIVTLSGPSEAAIADFQGVGTITNDDGVPALAINDAVVAELNAGTTTATFTVTLSPASAVQATVHYATANVTAMAGSDYIATSGTLTFAPGETTKTIHVTVNGETRFEPDETFNVVLSGATMATIGDGTGVGTITNDDIPPARVFVSVLGLDTNDCSNVLTPCRTLSAGISQVATDGEVIVTKSGSYAGSTITKSVKVNVAPGIVAFSGQPLTVNAGAGTTVVLRGLTLKAVTPGVGSGLLLQSAGAVFVENCVIDGWQFGIRQQGAAELFVKDSMIRNNQNAGLYATTGKTAVDNSRFLDNGIGIATEIGEVSLRGSILSGNPTAGVYADSSSSVSLDKCQIAANGVGIELPASALSTVRLSRSVVSGNGVGLENLGGTLLEVNGTNVVRGNVIDTTGTITTVGPQ